jgi:hypothetical protein
VVVVAAVAGVIVTCVAVIVRAVGMIVAEAVRSGFVRVHFMLDVVDVSVQVLLLRP